MALREFTYFFKRFGCTRRIKESIPREKNSRFQTGEGMRLGKRRRKSRKAKNKGREKTRLMKVTITKFSSDTFQQFTLGNDVTSVTLHRCFQVPS